jgi:hypothetical protein
MFDLANVVMGNANSLKPRRSRRRMTGFFRRRASSQGIWPTYIY